MKKIFTLLLGTMAVWSVAAQGDTKEPTFPPMENYGSLPTPGHQASPILKMRGMEIDDGYGILNPYGVARLFGGTPSHDYYMDGLRYRRVGIYTLWPGIALSATGILFATSEIGGGNSSDMEKDYRNSVVSTGVVMLVLSVPLIATGVTFRVKAKRSIARAVETYNQYTRSSSYYPRTPELSVGFTPGGVGLAYCF